MNCCSIYRPGVLLLTMLSFGSPIPGAPLEFELIPTGGSLTAMPGRTVGWGYSLTNNSVDEWLVPTSLNVDPFLFGQPMPLFDFPVLSPGASVSSAFDAVQMAGLYAVTIAPHAPFPFTEQGTFTLAAEWWSDDPAGGGTLLGAAADTSVPWRVEITGPDVPEPSYLLPLCIALPALYWVGRKRQLSMGGDK